MVGCSPAVVSRTWGQKTVMTVLQRLMNKERKFFGCAEDLDMVAEDVEFLCRDVRCADLPPPSHGGTAAREREWKKGRNWGVVR